MIFLLLSHLPFLFATLLLSQNIAVIDTVLGLVTFVTLVAAYDGTTSDQGLLLLRHHNCFRLATLHRRPGLGRAQFLANGIPNLYLHQLTAIEIVGRKRR